MKGKRYLIVLPTFCVAMLLMLLLTLPTRAERIEQNAINAINADTTWYVKEIGAGAYGWVSKPTDDNTAQPTDVEINRDIELNGGAKLTIEMPTEMKIVSPMASCPPEIQSIRDGDSVGGSVEIVEPAEPEKAFSNPTKNLLSINGADGTDGTAVKLSGGLTVDVKEQWRIKITGGKGSANNEGIGSNGGTGVKCAMTVAGGTLEIHGGEGGAGFQAAGNGGTGVDGDVTLTGGTLTIIGGNGQPGGTDGKGGTGVTGTVTLAGGTLTVNGGDGAGNHGQAPAFGENASVIIAEGYAYTDGTTVYPARTYTKNTTPSIDAFAGKTLSLCEAKIGDTFYATLQKAFNNAKEGDTITLLRDVEQKTTLDLNPAASLSLDLNGRKLLFNSGTEENFTYFMYDDKHMATITGSGTIEAIGLNESGSATKPLWRFCHDGDAGTGTGTLTILDGAAMKNIKNTGDRPWAAFTNSITEAALEEGVTKIGVVTFCACENLKTITIPATVKSINEDSSGLLPFDRCPKLEKIMVADDNETYTNNKIDGVSDGVLYTKDKTELLFCPRGKTGTLTVPAEVTTLKEYSFNNNDTEYNSTMSLSRIEFARTEPFTLSTEKPFYNYTGDCVLVAPDGMRIDNQRQAPATDYTTGTAISFRAVTPWDDLQDELNKGGTVKLTRSYDYTKDSYETTTTNWGITSYYGDLSVPKGTVLDLNGCTLAAAEFYGDGEFTVKGGTLNCTLLTNNATMGDPTNATYGTLTLDDATVTADQLQWFGGMALTESSLTVGESEEGAGNNGKIINVTWVQPESGAMLTMDTASSVTLPQQKETDGQWRLTDFQTSEDVAAAAGQLGTYLPRGWTFETITGKRVYGMFEQPYYALAVKDTAGAYPTSVTLRNYFSVQDGKVTAPIAGMVLICAEYDASGRMKSVKSVPLSKTCRDADAAALLGGSLPARCKLMLVRSGTYVPLCEAWDSAKK